MARGRQTKRATTSHANNMDYEQDQPLSPPRLRSEDVPEIHQHKIVKPQLEIKPDEVDNFVNSLRAFLEQVVHKNIALRRIVNNQELIVQYLTW